MVHQLLSIVTEMVKEMEVILVAEAKRRKMKFSSPKEIRQTLAKLANLVLNKEVSCEQAKTINSIANTILNSLRSDEYEKALRELEQIVAELEMEARNGKQNKSIKEEN